MGRRFGAVPQLGIGNERAVISALADAVGYVTAQKQPALAPLATTATTAQVIDKVNEIIARLQGTT